MPRKTLTRLVKVRDACEALGIGRTTFWQQWHGVFTDPREPDKRKPRFARRVYEDELSIAQESGRSAVLLHRRLMQRA